MKTTNSISVKVKNVTRHNGTSVCEGKLVFVEVGYQDILTPYIEVKVPNGIMRVNPIIISETEEIEMGGKLFSKGTNQIYDVKSISNNKYICYQNEKYVGDYVTNNVNISKILVLSENLSPKHLKSIIDGKLKDGDKVFIECEERLYERDALNGDFENKYIKLNKENHVTLHTPTPTLYESIKDFLEKEGVFLEFPYLQRTMDKEFENKM